MGKVCLPDILERCVETTNESHEDLAFSFEVAKFRMLTAVKLAKKRPPLPPSQKNET